LSLKSLAFPNSVARPERIGPAALRERTDGCSIPSRVTGGFAVLREEVRASPDMGGADRGVGPDLARGFAFLRASNMQVMRLQLAAERQDRRGVMAALDALAGIDRELGRFIDSMPDAGIPDIGRDIEAQRNDLLAQRMTLARGKIGPALSPAPARSPAELSMAAAPCDDPCDDHEAEEPARRWPWVLAAVLIACAALAAYALLGGGGALFGWELPA